MGFVKGFVRNIRAVLRHWTGGDNYTHTTLGIRRIHGAQILPWNLASGYKLPLPPFSRESTLISFSLPFLNTYSNTFI